MLESLNEVLWEEAEDWNLRNLRATLKYDPLQKAYTDACLLVHPDNHIGSPHYDLAKAIFEELTSSMDEYNMDLAQRLMDHRLKFLNNICSNVVALQNNVLLWSDNLNVPRYAVFIWFLYCEQGIFWEG